MSSLLTYVGGVVVVGCSLTRQWNGECVLLDEIKILFFILYN